MKTLIQILLGEFYNKIHSLIDLIPRQAQFPYAPNKIKVAIGMRRAGKTYFLFQYIRQLLKDGVPIQRILYINFEDDRLLPLDQQKLAALIETFYSLFPENHEQKCYLFLDEIQNVNDWPLVIRRFHDSKVVEIFLTGSSAKLLSKEIASSLRGRSLAIEIWPFNFDEFLQAKQLLINRTFYDKKTQDQATHFFHDYLLQGGFPETTHYDQTIRQQTLQEYVDLVIYRDIIERHEIKNVSVMKYMILYLLHNVSAPFSINKFYNDLKTQGYRIGKDLIYEYMHFIEDAYLAFSIPIYDRSLRKIQTNPKKIYAIDPGLIRAVTLDYESNLGKLFENVIYLDLRRHGCKVHYYLTQERFEVDFLVQTRSGKRKLFQVVWKVEHQETLLREERALEKAQEELTIEGEIITLDSYLQTGIQLP